MTDNNKLRHSPVTNVIGNELRDEDGIWRTGTSGFWSMLPKTDMAAYLGDLQTMKPEDIAEKHFASLKDLIFSPQRPGGLAILDIKPDDVVIDAGCMWGALTIPLARTGAQVIGLDQTEESLKFLYARAKSESLDNISLVQTDLNTVDLKPESINLLVLNGVMEWLGEGDIEAASLWAGKTQNENMRRGNPDDIQQAFLNKVHKALKPGGQLYLAIENRYDVANYFGARDPHTGQRGVTVLPRGLQNLFSKLFTKRPYRAWIHGEAGLRQMLKKAGYSDITVRYAFPDYRYPELVLTKEGMNRFRPVRYLKARAFPTKIFWYALEMVFYKVLRWAALSPSFIIVAKK